MSEQRKLYKMPETEAAYLRNLAGVKNNESLPPGLVDLYWGYRAVCARGNVAVIPTPMLCMLAFMAGVGLQPPPPATMFDLWKDGEITKQTDVEFRYRNGEEWKFGRIASVDWARRQFLIQGQDGLRYECKPDDVRLPEPAPTTAE